MIALNTPPERQLSDQRHGARRAINAVKRPCRQSLGNSVIGWSGAEGDFDTNGGHKARFIVSMIRMMMVGILIRRYVNVEIAMVMTMIVNMIIRLFDNGHRMKLRDVIAYPSKCQEQDGDPRHKGGENCKRSLFRTKQHGRTVTLLRESGQDDPLEISSPGG